MATISSHTLNGVNGTHAAGILVKLVHISSATELFSTSIDSAGRLSETVDLAGRSPADRYELSFLTANYWLEQGLDITNCIDEIVLRFKMPNPLARYHKPIILSPNGYSVWSSAPEE